MLTAVKESGQFNFWIYKILETRPEQGTGRSGGSVCGECGTWHWRHASLHFFYGRVVGVEASGLFYGLVEAPEKVEHVLPFDIFYGVKIFQVIGQL